MSERLLVVDDDDTVRRIYEVYFTRAGFEVEGAATLKEAAERLAGAAFDAVLADISLTPTVGSESACRRTSANAALICPISHAGGAAIW